MKGRVVVALIASLGVVVAAAALAEGTEEIVGREEAEATEEIGPPPSPPSATHPGEPHPFLTIHRVLTSPRCMNCHPKGDAPLQGDDSHPHAMNIKRGLEEVGLTCQTCHQERPVVVPHGPPGAPHWHLPPQETPMVFEGLGPAALCEQLKDPARNGQRSLDDLLHHVEEDALVLWGWNPGPGRTPVPVPHAEVVAAFRAWRDLAGSCPLDREPVTVE